MSNAGRLIFRGASGGFNIIWTTEDTVVRSGQDPSEIVFSARAMAEQDFESDTRGEEEDTPLDCDEERKFTILSIVGPFLSYLDERTQGCRGAMHPQHAVRFTTLDLSEPDPEGLSTSGRRQIRLDNFFAEADLLRGFLADPVVRRTLQNEGIPAPGTLRNLDEQVLSGTGLDVESEDVNLLMSRFFAFDPLSNFAFHHLEQNSVAVRICITPGTQVLAGSFSQLGILLPIPAELRQSLRQADSRQTGFLMKDDRNVSGGQTTTIRLTSGEGAGLFS